MSVRFLEDLNVDGNIAVSGTVDGVDIGANYANWNTAYGWGDHASAGYLTAETNLFLGDGGNLTTAPGTSRLIYTGQISNGVSGLFPASDNSNSIITLNRHSGNYDSQLGFSSNGNVYYRKFSNTAINTTQGWGQLLITDTNGNIVPPGTVDGVDIAARDAVLTSTTTTANAALPKAGGTVTGTLNLNSSVNMNGTNDNSTYFAQGNYVEFSNDYLSRNQGNEFLYADRWATTNITGTFNYGSTNVFRPGDNFAAFTSSTGTDNPVSWEVLTSVTATTNVSARRIAIFAHGGFNCDLRIQVKKSDSTYADVYNGSYTFNGSRWHLFALTGISYPSDWNILGIKVTIDDYGTTTRYIGQVGITNTRNNNTTPYIFRGGGNLYDNSTLSFGNGNDLQIQHDGSHSYISQGGTGNLYIQQNTNDADIVLQSDDGSGGTTAYITLDGSVVETKFNKDLRVIDNEKIIAGTSNDLEIFSTGADVVFKTWAGNMTFQQNANDKDIVFQSDDGSGGVTPYLTLDGSTTHAYFSNPGNVGIGTTSPDHLLQVESSGNAEIQAQRVAGAGVLIQSQSAVGVVGTNTNHRLDLKTNNSTRATISTSGNFGIGTTSPAKKLDVNGDTNITGYLDLTTSSPTGSPLLRFYQSTTRRGFIQMADTNNNLRVASEYGSVSLEAAATSGVDSDTSYIRINPGGTVEIGAVDGDATISTDGSMTFKIDADNDETSQKFSFVNNAGTEVASIDENGNLTLTGGINLSLPTSPGTTGTLWNDRGIVRVS